MGLNETLSACKIITMRWLRQSDGYVELNKNGSFNVVISMVSAGEQTLV